MFERVTPALPRPLEDEIPAAAHVLWWGRPGQGIRFRTFDIFLAPFSLFWAGGVFTIFGATFLSMQSSRSAGNDLTVIPFAAMFLLVGSYMAVGRLLVDMYRRSKTWYALTDREIIAVFDGPWHAVRRMDVARVPEVSVRGSRAGTIRFGSAGMLSGLDQMEYMGTGPRVLTFEFIPNVREVYQVVMDALRRN